MFSATFVISIFLLYLAGLFFLASFVEKKAKEGKNYSNNPYVYALSLAVFCTAWTYYGSVGKAASSGYMFMTIYLGPIAVSLLWWNLLRRMVLIKEKMHVTSLADFLSARYGKSYRIGFIITAIATIGTIPYISIQLKSIIDSFTLLVSPQKVTFADHFVQEHLALLVILLMILFTIVFGLRKLDPTERHQGMMSVIAIESIIKLASLIIVGVFISYFIFDGIEDIFTQYEALEKPPTSYDGFAWVSVLILSMAGILLLPRQFHVAVVENANIRHIKTAMWLLPLYLILITFFTLPIALSGALFDLPEQLADMFVLLMPFQRDSSYLSLVAFIGGFSASTSMVMITSMAMAIMISNYLVLPFLEKIAVLRSLKKQLLLVRWVIVAFFISAGYWFYKLFAQDALIANVGVISFVAILQFLPSFLGALYWKKAHEVGALVGLVIGFFFWFYILILPYLGEYFLFAKTLVHEGAFSSFYLRPESLFGMQGLNQVSSAVFWSLTFNSIAFIFISFSLEQKESHKQLADIYVDILKPQTEVLKLDRSFCTISLTQKEFIIKGVLKKYLPAEEVQVFFDETINRLNIKEKICIDDLASLNVEVEKKLAGLIGSAGAHKEMRASKLFSKEESELLSNLYAQMLGSMHITPKEFTQKINFYKEKEELLNEHAKELEKKVKERDSEIEVRKRVEEDLKENRQRLQGILDHTFQFIGLLSLDGKLVDANKTALNFIKLAKDEVVGKEFWLTPWWSHSNEAQEQIKEGISKACQGEFVRFESMHKHNEKTVYVDFSLTPVKDENEKMLFIIPEGRDITKRKETELALKELNETLEERVNLRTKELQSSNEELTMTLETLKSTQDQLVQSEKMAALGGLVAGVAHEINTPLGNGITGITHLTNATMELSKLYENEQMSEEEFEHFLQTNLTLQDSIYLNLKRAGELVKSFKQIAVDQSSEQQRSFHLHDVFNEVLLSLHNYLKKRKNRIEVHCDNNIVLNSYPGVYSQIFTNLIMNACIHAFEKDEDKTLHFNVAQKEDALHISCEDNGKGIHPHDLEKIFDPFFTTNRSAGGTGLGLNIIYNLITQKLDGSIECKSEVGQYTRFLIKIPYKKEKNS